MIRSRWTIVLALLLLTQWSAAFGHCRALAAAAPEPFAQTICSVGGHGAVSADHDPGSQKNVSDQDCPACHQLPVVPAASPPSGSVPLRWVAVETEHNAVMGTRPPARAPPYDSHAPPAA